MDLNLVDVSYEIFNGMKEKQQDKYKNLCHCQNCSDKNDEDGLYPHCSHFSTCASDEIAKQLEEVINAIERRLIDRGFNVLGDFLGYYDKYVLWYVPNTYQNYDGEVETSKWGHVEIHSKEKVFNPYKYCGGYGFEYEKLGELSITQELWDMTKKCIYKLNLFSFDGKEICFDDPYPEPRTIYYQGSDVPISGRYE